MRTLLIVQRIVVSIVCIVLSVKFGFDAKDSIKWATHPTLMGQLSFSNIAASTTTPSPAKWSTNPPELNPPADHPPLRIVVDAYEYTVHYTTREWLTLNGCEAATMHGSRTIWLSRSETDPRQIMMHELFHVAKYAAGQRHWSFPAEANTMENANHDFISPAAPEFLLILRRNPALVRWLTDLNHGSISE